MFYSGSLIFVCTTMLFGFGKKPNTVEIVNQIIIEKPIEEVYWFLANFENMPKWNYYLKTVKKTSEGPIGIGTIFHQVRKSDEQDYKITEMEVPYILTIETLPPERHLIMCFKLSVQGNSTLVEDTWNIEASWLLALFAKKKVKSAVKENLMKLKTLLENRTVELQDGRIENLD
jgi:Polyketide cyclase / dehydrase and lipid transport